MKTISKVLFMAGLSAAVIVACKKKEEEPTTSTTNTTTSTTGGSSSSMGTFFTQNAVTSQTFTISNSSYQSVTGTKGTVIVFPPNSFVTQTNGAVTGNVVIELKEVFSKKDMILTGMVPMAGQYPLVSGGEIFLKATQGSQTLKIASGAQINAAVPAGNNPSTQMNEFYATNTTATDTTGWTASTDSISVQQDTVFTGGYYYSFVINGMNWINCDYFYNDPAPKTSVTVNPGTGYNSSNCVVFLSVDGQNSVAQLYNYNGAFTTSNWPVGKAVTIIAISEINGQYYSAFKTTTLTANHSESMTMVPTTLSQINTSLAGLP
jgi:hypothetical protein